MEAVNRIMMALAVYRLERAKGSTPEVATRAADDIIIDTQIDYANVNAPRLLKHGAIPGGKLIFQFRKYQHAMLQLILENAYKWFKGKSAAKKQARKTIGMLVAMQIGTAGVIGVPMYGLAAGAVNLFLDDDDEKGDIETRMRNFTADLWGPDISRMLWKGPLSYLLDIDLTKRTGLGDIASPLPFMRTGADTGQEALGNFLVAAGGAPTGMMLGFWNAGVKLEEGEYWQAVESALPKGFKDISKAARFSADGVRSASGKQAITEEQYGVWDVATRALGFTSMGESEYYDANSAQWKVKNAINDKRERLLKDYSTAMVDGDYEKAREVRKEVREFNKEHWKFRINGNTLAKSAAARRSHLKDAVRPETGAATRDEKLKDLDRFTL